VKPAVEKWTLEYLSKHMGDKSKFDVYSSRYRKFRYYDEEKNLANYKFVSSWKKTQVSFAEFEKMYHEKTEQPKYMYLQQILNEGVGPQIVADFKYFDWSWVSAMALAAKMGPLKFNTLWISKKDIITMCHYDEAFNFFGQVRGKKKFTLFSPNEFKNLYPFPLHHANDRQCMVDIDDPDLEQFPNFVNSSAVVGVVGPGDVLYIPPYWFHHVDSLEDSISINFWFILNNSQPEAIKFPLSPSQKMAVRRNIERLIAQALGPREVGDFLKELAIGRYEHHEYEDTK